MTDWSTYTDEELRQMQMEISEEQARRFIPTQIASLNEVWMSTSPDYSEGDPWIQPTGAHNAYPKGWVVTHDGKTWASLVDTNVWEPPTNWREDSGEEWPAWVQPTGSEDAYAAGAKVSHVDKHWTSDVDANVWEPSVYGWTEV